MCGIAGIANLRGDKIQKNILEKMCRKMEHRGPDDEGIYISNKRSGVRGQGSEKCSVGLGHRRLSIIDLSTAGRQPMCNEDKTIWVVLNGEIYNFLELRLDLEKQGHEFKSNSDTEVILHLYENHGKNCVKYLQGMFAFALWDENQKFLMLGRDRVGKKPLYYSFINNIFAFASELSALIVSGTIELEVNEEAIHHYLTFGYIPSPLSIYKNVFKLPPASILALKKGSSPVIKKYWNLNFSKKIKISEEEAAEETLRLLKNSVKKRLNSDVPLGAFLSGGIDSSVVVALMAEMSGNRVKTFSIGFDDSDYNELEHAKRIANKFNTEHHEFIVHPNALNILPLLVERYGEPYADSSAIPTYYVSQQTKKFVTVALNGDGGDEVFAGYERYQAVLISEVINKIPSFFRDNLFNGLMRALPDSINFKSRSRRLKRFINGALKPLNIRYLQWIGFVNDQMKKELYSDDFTRKVACSNPLQFINPYMANSNNTHLLDRLLMVDTMTYLPGDLLVKVDIASMANSLEVRSPFLDHRLVEFAASIPHKYKMKRMVKKYLLKKVASKLIPQENIYRRKMGFGVPVGRWFRYELKDFLREILLSPASLSRGYFKPQKVKSLVEAHISGQKDYNFQLWSLMMLELWHLKFVDKSL
tara:strand:- start:2027 stop:3961 length:1935 start_codon:yes stop_codon:yes gene_type:complete